LPEVHPRAALAVIHTLAPWLTPADLAEAGKPCGNALEKTMSIRG
jgi:hypothetical protein